VHLTRGGGLSQQLTRQVALNEDTDSLRYANTLSFLDDGLFWVPSYRRAMLVHMGRCYWLCFTGTRLSGYAWRNLFTAGLRYWPGGIYYAIHLHFTLFYTDPIWILGRNFAFIR